MAAPCTYYEPEADIAMVVHGDDYSDEKQRHMYRVPIERGIFRTVPYTKGISTTKIIGR